MFGVPANGPFLPPICRGPHRSREKKARCSDHVGQIRVHRTALNKFLRDLGSGLRVQQYMSVKQEVTFRLVSVLTTVSLLTFGALVETYKLLS